MKRAGNLFGRIVALENLQMAYLKARKGKCAKEEVYSYGKKINNNLEQLSRELITGTAKAGGYRSFTVFDPKERRIFAAPFHQRVLHHALMNICHCYFEKVQIYDSYASRIGKGTYAALDRARLNSRKYTWYLKLDVRKYFDNIDHGVLKQQLRRLFKDRRLLSVLDGIIDGYHTAESCGVPIGNLTSQYFANHYLACADHYVKENLRVAGYVRYMDDMVLWHGDKESLKNTDLLLQKYLEKELHLFLKPFCLNRSSKGLSFLGYLIYPGKVLLNHRSKKRFIEKLHFYNNKILSGEWSQGAYRNHVQPLIAFTEHADTLGLRRKIILEM